MKEASLQDVESNKIIDQESPVEDHKDSYDFSNAIYNKNSKI